MHFTRPSWLKILFYVVFLWYVSTISSPARDQNMQFVSEARDCKSSKEFSYLNTNISIGFDWLSSERLTVETGTYQEVNLQPTVTAVTNMVCSLGSWEMVLLCKYR